MVGRLILAWRSSSSSSSPAFCLLQNRLYRAKRGIDLQKWQHPKIYPFDPHAPADAGELAKAQSSEHWELFQSWMKEHKKRYRGGKEMLYRFEIFTNCVKYIEEKNKELDSYQLGLNDFSDLTVREFPRGGELPEPPAGFEIGGYRMRMSRS